MKSPALRSCLSCLCLLVMPHPGAASSPPSRQQAMQGLAELLPLPLEKGELCDGLNGKQTLADFVVGLLVDFQPENRHNAVRVDIVEAAPPQEHELWQVSVNFVSRPEEEDAFAGVQFWLRKRDGALASYRFQCLTP